MTGVHANKLTAYHLNDDQWELSDEILEVLKVLFDSLSEQAY